MADNYDSLISLRDTYVQLLLEDAANGSPPTHTIDNVTIDATAWRADLIKQIGILNNLISACNPQEIISIIV